MVTDCLMAIVQRMAGVTAPRLQAAGVTISANRCPARIFNCGCVGSQSPGSACRHPRRYAQFRGFDVNGATEMHNNRGTAAAACR